MRGIPECRAGRKMIAAGNLDDTDRLPRRPEGREQIIALPEIFRALLRADRQDQWR